MTYQEYVEKCNKLINEKDVLYDIASRKLNRGDNTGAQAVYTLIDEVQSELNALVNPNDTDEEELELKFNS